MRKLFLAMSAVCLAHVLGAADHTIASGASETLSENTSYDRLVVNGNLTLEADVELSVASLCVASNSSGTVNLTLGEGAKLTVSGTEATDCLIGAAGGQVSVVLGTDSSLVAKKALLGIGYGANETLAAGASDTKVTITINDGAVFKTTAGLNIHGESYDKWPSGTKGATANVDIQLNKGGELQFYQINFRPSRVCNLKFNGGRLKAIDNPWKQTALSISWMNSSQPFTFVSVDGNPIDIYLWANHTSLMSGGSVGSNIKFLGEGDLVLSGKYGGGGSNSQNRSLIGKGHAYWQHTGKIVINDDLPIKLNGNEGFGDTTYYTPHALALTGKGYLDLNAQSFTVTTLAAEPTCVLTNSSETVCTLTLDNGATDWSCMDRITLPDTLSLVKRGAGTLTVPQGFLSNLTVAEGGLNLLGRAEVGYPYVKFNVYGTGATGSEGARVYLGELVYLNGEEDVTQGWTDLYYSHEGTDYYNSPTNALDQDLTTYFYDQRAQLYATVSNIHFELKYALPHKVTGYKWTYPNGMDSYSRNPTSWEVFGSDDNKTWISLDYVRYKKASWSGWTQRPCAYTNAVVYPHALSLAAGTSLKVTSADASSAATAAETLELANGAKVALADGTRLQTLTIDADDALDSTIVNAAFAATGVLNVTGTAAKLPADLPLALPGAADNVLTGWTVNYNGEPVRYYPMIKDGRLTRLSTQGMVIYLK